MMIRQMQAVVADRAKAINGQLTRFGHETLRSARRAASDGASSLSAEDAMTDSEPTTRGGGRIGVREVARLAGVREDLLDEVRLAIGEACTRAVALHRQYGLREPVLMEMSSPTPLMFMAPPMVSDCRFLPMVATFVP